MTEDQAKGFEYLVEYAIPQIYRMTNRGMITLDEAVYSIQRDLLDFQHSPWGFCNSNGIELKGEI